MRIGSTALLLLLALGALAAGPLDGVPTLTVPDDDLATARLGDMTIYFLPSGAFLLRYGERDLLDIGLVISRENYKIRARQSHTNQEAQAFEELPVLQDDGSVVWKGTIRVDGYPWNQGGTASFRELREPGPNVPLAQYQQTVEAIEGGIRVHYRLNMKPEPVKVDQVGLTVTLPIQHWGTREASFWTLEKPAQKAGEAGTAADQWKPVGKPLALPSDFTRGKPMLRGDLRCQRIELAGPDRLLVRLEFPQLTRVRSLDGRQWENYYYWLDTYEAVQDGTLACDPPLEFDLTLTAALRPEEEGPAAAETRDAAEEARYDAPFTGPELPDRPVVVLPDDRETRGDWPLRYGTEAHILCAMKKYDLVGGLGWPLNYSRRGYRKEVKIGHWIGTLMEQGDKRALYNPHGGGRTPAVWDDRGELEPLGQGPDLLIELEIPRGLYVLSFYFFEIDWPQYRAYDLTLSSEGKQLARVPVRDFFNGVYKRFAVRGPMQLQALVERLQSPNVVVSAVFLDPLRTWPLAGKPPPPLALEQRVREANEVIQDAIRTGELTGPLLRAALRCLALGYLCLGDDESLSSAVIGLRNAPKTAGDVQDLLKVYGSVLGIPSQAKGVEQ